MLHDDTSYDYSQTRQAVREQQEITLTSAGLYDTQTLTLAINRSAVVEDALPRLVLEWGGRSTEPISLVELEENPGLYTTVMQTRRRPIKLLRI